MKQSIALLEEMTQADGVSGFEDEVREIFTRRLKAQGDILRDGIGGVICRKKGRADRPRIMLDCHLDEIGFMIQNVTGPGYLKFLNLGGWSGHVLSAQRVRVHAGDNVFDGVIGATPPHHLPAERRDNALKIPDLFIDIGASSREEAESWGVRPGSWAVPHSPFTQLHNEKLFVSKAFDNRAGCALAVEITKRVRKPAGSLYAAGSVQEEVGCRGAVATAEMIDPDVAIVLECPPADDLPAFAVDDQQGRLGGGVQIRAYDPTMIANPKLVDLAVKTAEEKGIPCQVAVRASGGTNASKIHLNARGVPSVVLGVPARYIHSHTSVMNIDDYVAVRDLAVAMIERLDRKTVAGLR